LAVVHWLVFTQNDRSRLFSRHLLIHAHQSSKATASSSSLPRLPYAPK
jgi:hypothetical protein